MEYEAVKRRQQCADIVKNVAVAVSRLMNHVFGSNPRLKPGAKRCRNSAAKHSSAQRTKICAIPGHVNSGFPPLQPRPTQWRIMERENHSNLPGRFSREAADSHSRGRQPTIDFFVGLLSCLADIPSTEYAALSRPASECCRRRSCSAARPSGLVIRPTHK